MTPKNLELHGPEYQDGALSAEADTTLTTGQECTPCPYPLDSKQGICWRKGYQDTIMRTIDDPTDAEIIDAIQTHGELDV